MESGTRVCRRAYAAIAWVFVAGILTQVFLIGLTFLGGRPNLQTHAGLGHGLAIAPLMMVALAYAGRLPRPMKLFTWLALVVYVLLSERSVGAGETIDIPRNVPHYFWNDGNEEAHAIQEFRPALNIEDFFDTYFALARAGKLTEKGIPPNLFHMAVLIQEFDQVIRVMNPPRLVQLLLITLAPFGRLLGYRGIYPRREGEIT